MEPPKPKRQKVNLACDTCRSRKIKCDGRQPVCEPCRKKGANGPDCVWKTGNDRRFAQTSTKSSQWQELRPYPQSDTRPSSQTHQIDATGQSRGSVLAAERSRSTAVFDSSNLDGIGAAQPTEIPTGHTQASQSSTVSNAVDVRTQGDGHTLDQVSPSEHSVHAIIGTTQDSDNGEGFFGSSSAGNFMQNVKKMVQRKIVGVQHQPGADKRGSHQTLPASGNLRAQPAPVEYVLPSRRRADILMSCYWKYVHVLYPYLDKKQTIEDYEKLWRTDTSDSITDERSYMCLLNVIFALSSQIDDSIPVPERQQLAHTFYIRAKELLDMVETGLVRSVQCFLLLGQYYQSTSEPHPCWIFTGLAVRTAQSLGLHLAETSERITDIRTRELLRKVWYGCVLMDRVVSMTYGRPCMVGPMAASVVPLPLAIDEDYLVPANAQGQLSQQQSALSQQTFNTEFFVLSLKLYEIMHDVIYYFYSVNFQPRYFGEKFFVTLDNGKWSLFEVERRLSMWANGIPQRFKLHSSGEAPTSVAEATVRRQAVILHQRQLHVRLLLLRSVLSNFISSELSDGEDVVPTDSLLFHRVYLQCSVVCVEVAIEAIDIIHREGGGRDGKMGYCAAPWYNVLYLYTSATVLIAARLAPTILAEISEEKILASWNKAIEILNSYTSTGPSIERLKTTLALLFDAVPEQYSRFKSNAKASVQVQNGSASANQDRDRDHGQVGAQSAYWRTRDFVTSGLTPQADAVGSVQNGVDTVPDDFLLDFNVDFDPNDLDWLMTIPLET